jgi:hypothetical protein
MAPQEAPHRKVQPLEGAVLPESLQCILGAGGGESAGRWSKRAYAQLVELDKHYRRETKYLFDRIL